LPGNPGPAEVMISVIDNGAGMPGDLVAAPFEPAQRRRGSSSGAGLGLSIAKGIVEAHGGRIELHRQPRGTCFRICLPVEAAPTPGRNGRDD
jgi:signal transduction histidine kinase